MTTYDWREFNNAKICKEGLVKPEFFNSMPVWDHNTGKYCGQSHRGCFYKAFKEIVFEEPKAQRKPKDDIDKWIEKNQEECLLQNTTSLQRL